MGRNVFQADDPIAMIKAVRGVVHDGLKPKEAYDLYLTQTPKAAKAKPSTAKAKAPAKKGGKK